jgi:hypothetical protein
MPLRLTATWLSVLVAAAALLAATGYRTRDADSRAYIAIAARMAGEPASRWIAPQWWGAWGGQGLFREHPAGAFVPAALLTRAGYPAGQSLFVVTLAAQVIALLALSALCRAVVPAPHARLLVWALQLIPIAFVFRVRANQEYLLLAALLVALYGLERARTAAAWALVAVGGTIAALLVKGVFGLLAPVLAALWLWSRRRHGAPGAAGWLTLLAMAAAPLALAWAYEHVYVAATGQSFLGYYLGSRIGLEAGGLPFPANKIWNALWYLGRLMWYAAPWSALGAMALAAWRPAAAQPAGAQTWVRFALLAAGAIVALVAARDTRADRYIFPAYFFAASGGLVWASVRWARVAALAERLDETWPWGPAVLWLLLVAGRVAVG